jgi:Cysteine-rich secretory protein family
VRGYPVSVTEQLPAPETGPVVRRRLRALLVVAAALVLGLFSVLGTPRAAAAFDEGTIHSLVNQSRAANSLGPLALNASLSQVAAGWANQLAANGSLSHNPQYSSQIPGGWTKAAENVAQGYPSGAAVHEGWMNSSGHRTNILGDFTDIGIAHISAGGTTWSVEVFGKYGSSVPAPQPAPPAPAPVPAAPKAEPAPPVPEPEQATEAPPTPSATAAPSPSERSAPNRSRAESNTRAEGSAPADSAGIGTKLALGLALLASVAVAAVGGFRLVGRR